MPKDKLISVNSSFFQPSKTRSAKRCAKAPDQQVYGKP